MACGDKYRGKRGLIWKNFNKSSIGDDGMQEVYRGLTRSPEETIEFKHLIQTIIWLKKKTGKPSYEVVNAVFNIAKKGLNSSSEVVHQRVDLIGRE